ncbi:MAG TPA: hypothetical protein VH482_05070 [Thermomicrobiales bacterium]
MTKDVLDAPRTDHGQVDDQRSRQQRIALNREVIALLDSWLEGDEEDEREQHETLEALKRAIDEDRPLGLKLFS